MFERVLRGDYKSKVYKKSLRMSYLSMQSKDPDRPGPSTYDSNKLSERRTMCGMVWKWSRVSYDVQNYIFCRCLTMFRDIERGRHRWIVWMVDTELSRSNQFIIVGVRKFEECVMRNGR